jgi:hypothetical protein
VITIIYDPNLPVSISDGRVDGFVDNLLLHMPAEVEVCNESVIDEIRLRICRGELDPGEVVFSFEGLIITADANSSLSEWPEGFCDSMSNRLFKRLTCYADKEEGE